MWRLVAEPPTALLHETLRKPPFTVSGRSPSAWRSASSFHMVTRALALACVADTLPPDQSELQRFSSP
jgi:hypothetical protein